ncbi:MAG: hypothetical protein LBQ88_09585 [Treponema sp.]|jgi:hypothetical protein|nr:hypothetical protein [Treponema sp.]
MKKRGLVLVFLLLCFLMYSHAENQRFSIGNFNFSLSPKILKDGSITDIGLGLAYTDAWSGEVRFRNTSVSKNEEFQDVADSLNAVNESIFEVFFLPAQYSFVKTPAMRLWAGGGLYYEYNRLEEKGFFNMPILEQLNPPKERVNSYTSESSMHIFGPLLDAGGVYNAEWFSLTFSAGIAPVFFLQSARKMDIVPLIAQGAEYDQSTWGSPYFYLSLDGVIFKYVNIVLLYDFVQLDYKIVDFDLGFNWITPEQKLVSQSFKIEASALAPLGGGIRAQIGYGFTFDSTQIDSGTPVRENRQYLILTVKKIGG